MSTPSRNGRDGADRHDSTAGELGGSTLPGFMIPFGSKLALIACISGIRSPCSRSSAPILPRPTPCSPVHVPPRARASSTMLRTSSSEAATPSGGELHRDVEVAVAGVAEDAGFETEPLDLRACEADGARELGEGHADVGRPLLRSREPCGERVGDVVPRLPQAGSRLGVALVDDLRRAFVAGDRLDELEVGVDELGAAGGLDEEAAAPRGYVVPE